MKSFMFLLLVFQVSHASGYCLDFFYVKRPVALGAVYHEYVAARDPRSGKSEAFGLLKGSEDLRVFVSVVEGRNDIHADLKFLGSACDENAHRASSNARTYAKKWEDFYDNELLFYSRMGVTPVVGKPCRNVALEISELVKKFLH